MRLFKTPTREEMRLLQQWLSHWILFFISFEFLLSCFKFVIGESRGRWCNSEAIQQGLAAAAAAAASVSAGLRIPSNTTILPSKEGRAVSAEGHGRHRFQKKAPSAGAHCSAFCKEQRRVRWLDSVLGEAEYTEETAQATFERLLLCVLDKETVPVVVVDSSDYLLVEWNNLNYFQWSCCCQVFKEEEDI